jgi:hypothetical protein
MKSFLLIAAAIAASSAAAPVRAGEFYAGAGLPGLMLGFAQPIDESITLRGDWATLGSRSKRYTESGVAYDGKASFNRTGLFGDWFVSGGFRLTGGVTFNNLKADLVARGDGVTPFDIGGRVFVADPADQLNVKVSYPKTTPYLGVGYGHQLGEGWGFTFDLGASYGKATVSETHSGPNLGNPAVVTQADIDREMIDVRDAVAKFKYIPQLSLGFSRRF